MAHIGAKSLEFNWDPMFIGDWTFIYARWYVQIGDLNVSIFIDLSDRRSDSFGHNLIPSDQRSERPEKIDTFRSLIW